MVPTPTCKAQGKRGKRVPTQRHRQVRHACAPSPPAPPQSLKASPKIHGEVPPHTHRTYLILRNKHRDERCKQLRRRAAGREKRGTRHIIAETQLLTNAVQRRHKVIVRDNGKAEEEEEHARNVEAQ